MGDGAQHGAGAGCGAHARRAQRLASSPTARRTGRVLESVDELQQEQGIAADYLRLRAYPFSAAVQEFIEAHERVYVVEQNRDAQMLQLIKMNIDAKDVVRLRSVLHYRRASAGCTICNREHCGVRAREPGGEVMATTPSTPAKTESHWALRN